MLDTLANTLPEWLHPTAAGGAMLWTDMLFRLGMATVFGLAIAGVYAATQRRAPGQIVPFFTTLVLLTILVAVTTIVIGDSVARAFGLVGALSIVRFRTVVEDTRDTAFVIFAVIFGMALGAGNLLVAIIGFPAVAAVAGILAVFNRLPAMVERHLEVRLSANREPESTLAPVFDSQLQSYKLASVVSARGGTALDLIYIIRLRKTTDLLPFVRQVSALEGVQNVDLKEQ
jgi:hypothetical protein